MLAIPYPILVQYTAILNEHQIVGAHYVEYQNWLRYYLDYCHKYPVPDANSERIRLFCEKLREKKQSELQRRQAVHAVSLYYALADEDQPDNTGCAGKTVGSGRADLNFLYKSYHYIQMCKV